MGEPKRIAVLASGGGSNFQSLVDHFNSEDVDRGGRVVGVVASRDTAGVLDRAANEGVASAVAPAAADSDGMAAFLLEQLDAWGADFVVLAGYMRLVPPEVVRAYLGRMVNIHPALLPAFGGKGMYGGRVHGAVIEAGARVSGVTIHFVDEAYDRGPILCQWPVPVLSADRPETLAARVLRVEHRVLPLAVEALARGDVRLEGDRHVEWRREWFGTEEFHQNEKLQREG